MLILFRGLPGAGKTTLAKEYESPQVRIVSADDFFESDDGYEFDPSKLGQAHDLCQARTEKYLLEGKTVIVHNTCTKTAEIQHYDRIAKKVGVTLAVYTLPEESLETLMRRGVHNVPARTMLAMQERFVPDAEVQKAFPLIRILSRDKLDAELSGDPVAYYDELEKEQRRMLDLYDSMFE